MNSALFSKITTTSIISIGTATLLAAVLITGNAAASNVDYDVNDNGLTYGSAYVTDSDELQQQAYLPDLVLAYASNGELGYYYSRDKAELQEAWASRSLEEIEADAVLQAKALMNASDELFGIQLFDYEDAYYFIENHNIAANEDSAITRLETAAVETLHEAGANGIAHDELCSLLSEVDGSFENSIHVSDAALQTAGEYAVNEIYQAARTNTAFRLPVYTSDGKTVIGEYLITTM